MALEWVVVGCVAAAEATMVLLLTLPGPHPFRRALLSLSKRLLKPCLSVIPFCLFLLVDIYWKHESRPTCEAPDSCSPSELLRHQKAVAKSERNLLLAGAALVFWWLMFVVTRLAGQAEVLSQRVEKMKNLD